jgi:hypothetical protein
MGQNEMIVRFCQAVDVLDIETAENLLDLMEDDARITCDQYLVATGLV